MKKIIATVLMIILIFSFAACGKNAEDAGLDDSSHTHNYVEYKCTECGLVEAAHSYDYLARFVKENGTADGTEIFIQYEEDETLKCELRYSVEQEFLCAIFTKSGEDGLTHNVELRLDTYQYTSTYWQLEMKGTLDAETFGRDSTLPYDDYIGPESIKGEMVDVTKSALLVLINKLEMYLWLNFQMIGTFVEDLGFKAM